MCLVEDKMKMKDSPFSLPSLLCHEDETCFDEKPGRRNEDEEFTELNEFDSGEEDEHIEMLLRRERSTDYKCSATYPSDDVSIANRRWLKSARSDAIRWILNTRAVFGFHYCTAFLSVIYFDRFLSRRSIDNGKLWAVRLLSVACLSLAAKMEEREAPPLSEYTVEEYIFEASVIQTMEIIVLDTLEWKMVSATPFSFLNSFILRLHNQSKAKELFFRAAGLVLSIAKEINSMDHPQSSIAVAAVLAASEDQLSSTELKVKCSLISSCGPLENEHIYSCYNLMQEIEMGKLRIPALVISSYLPSSLADSNSSAKSLDTKRRLTFNDSGQNQKSKKIQLLIQ